MAYTIRLVGGTCDGRAITVQRYPFALGHTTCGGDVYVAVQGYYDPFVFQEEHDFANNVPVSLGAGRSTGASDRQVTAQWTRLMRVLAVNGPRQLRRASAATARIRARTR